MRLFQVINVTSMNQYYLVMQLVEGGSWGEVRTGGELLGSTIEPMRLCRYAHQLARALCYLKSEHCVQHGDIKPANVFIDKKAGKVQLGDFGVSQWLRSVEGENSSGGSDAPGLGAVSEYGTPEFGPPMTLHRQGVSTTSMVLNHQNQQVRERAFAADVYALGLTLYCVLSGRLPGNPDRPDEYEQAKKSGRIDFPDVTPAPQDISDDVRQGNAPMRGPPVPLPCRSQ